MMSLWHSKSKGEKRLYVVPTFNQCGYRLKSPTGEYKSSVEVQSFHYELMKLLGEGHPLLPAYNYKSVCLETALLLEQGESFYFPDYVEDANIRGQLDSYDQLSTLIEARIAALEVQFGETTAIINTYRAQLEQIREKQAGSVNGTMLAIQGAETYKSMSTSQTQFIEGTEWLISCITFFKYLTERGVCFHIDCYDIQKRVPNKNYSSCDYFLFDEAGQVKQFVALGTLDFHPKWYAKEEQPFILDNNIRAFRKWIESVCQVMITGEGYYKHALRYRTHPLHILWEAPYAYFDFEEVLAIVRKGHYVKGTHERIGVFIDGRNILYNLEPLKINYYRLLHTLYGADAISSILIKKCVLFASTFEDRYRQARQVASVSKMKAYLEEEGFEVEVITNGKQKADQVDDERLIEVIRSYQMKLDRVLIMTGDKHFVPIIEAYRDAGKEVYVASLEEENTAKEIVDLEGITHYYIESIRGAIEL